MCRRRSSADGCRSRRSPTSSSWANETERPPEGAPRACPRRREASTREAKAKFRRGQAPALLLRRARGYTSRMSTFALHTDLYQLTMLASYFHQGRHNERAVCEMFVRRLPKNRRFLVVAGLQRALRYLEG